MARIAVIEGRHGLNVWRQCLRERRHAGDVAGAARQHHGAALQHARIRRDGVPDVCTCDRGDGGVRAHGSGDHHRVARDELHYFAHGHVAVRITAFVVIPGQSALPVGRQQTKRIPALPAPGIRRLSALEHDVVDGASSETLARRKTRMPGPDDDRGDLLDGDARFRCAPPKRARLGYLDGHVHGIGDDVVHRGALLRLRDDAPRSLPSMRLRRF